MTTGYSDSYEATGTTPVYVFGSFTSHVTFQTSEDDETWTDFIGPIYSAGSISGNLPVVGTKYLRLSFADPTDDSQFQTILVQFNGVNMGLHFDIPAPPPQNKSS